MNPAKLTYTCKAEDDLDTIFDYIAKDSPANTLNYIAKIQKAIENLATSPYIGVHCRTKGIE